MSNKINSVKIGVIGVGYLGRFHAEKYALCEYADLIFLCDHQLDNIESLAKKWHAKVTDNYKDMLSNVDAVSIVVPTREHFQVALDCLNAGLHVLLEKPMTTTLQEADKLIQAAKDNNCILQIGHLERFNPTLKALDSLPNRPHYIEAKRLAPYNPRGADVNVVLDLMIHDLDLLCHLAQSPVTTIQAQGHSLITNDIDFAIATLSFSNGMMATLTASRIATSPVRTLDIHHSSGSLHCDLQDKTAEIRSPQLSEDASQTQMICQSLRFDHRDALDDEVHAFLKAITRNTDAAVTAKEGRDALELALKITDLINANPAVASPPTHVCTEI